jgi:hypothetical protein
MMMQNEPKQESDPFEAHSDGNDSDDAAEDDEKEDSLAHAIITLLPDFQNIKEVRIYFMIGFHRNSHIKYTIFPLIETIK